MIRNLKIFNRGFPLRKAFSITNLAIASAGVVFVFVILGALLKVKREEIAFRLDREAELASARIETIFNHAECSVQYLASSFSILSELPRKKSEKWFHEESHNFLATNPHHYNLYLAFTKKMSKKLVHRDGYILVLAKDANSINVPQTNGPLPFYHQTLYDPVYQTSPQEHWYEDAVKNPGVQLLPLYFDRTYFKRIMISITAAGRDLKTGEILGVAGTDLTAGTFSKLLGQFRIGSTGGVLLTDELGNAIKPFLNRDEPLLGFKYDPKEEMNPAFELHVSDAPVLPVKSGASLFRGKDGEHYLLHSKKMEKRPYYVVSYQNRTESYSPIYWALGVLGALFVIYVMTSLLFRQKLDEFIFKHISDLLKNISGNRKLFEDPAREGRFERLSPDGPSEVVQIANQLNLLYARLQSSFLEVQSERDRAEDASRSKSQFLSVMSHEIRTPLNSMLGLTDVLLKSDLNGEQIQYLSVLKRSGNSLLRILNNILDFSRLEAGKLTIEPHEFELFLLLADIESLMRLAAEEKNIEFRILAPTKNYTLRGDSVRIRQVLLNLVGNAVKFTTSGTVAVSVTAVEGLENIFQFEVSDTGIGIEKAHQENLFSEFYQADASITRRYGGTGLGLSISRDMVTLMGGTISLDSTPGSGSVFQFSVPLPIVAQWEDKYVETPTGIHPSSPTQPPVDQLALGKLVLVVDDDEDSHFLIDAYLGNRNDVSAVHALSAPEAIEKVHIQPFDLIIMDMQMPKMDGLEGVKLIRALHTRGEIPQCPIVILSANTYPEDIEKSLAAGADAHIAKPITLPEFNQLLKRWIPGIS